MVAQTTADLQQHLTPLAPLQFGSVAPPAGTPTIDVDDAVRYQRVSGFGAAMTDSSAWLIERGLPAASAAQLMGELFSPSGLGLDFVRVPIGASDFTAKGVPYTYDDVGTHKRDPRLARFSIAHDRSYILPALRQARAINSGTEFLGTPWTPPAWMKANDSLSNRGNRGTLLGSAYGPWAAYIVRFLRAYAAAGVPIAAVTPQNEPGVATSYPGLNLSSAAESNLIAQDLAPALVRAHLSVKLYGGDTGWSPSSSAFAQAVATGSGASDLAGVAWHCYFGSPEVMSELHARVPSLDEIVDECAPGISALPTSEVVISSLRNWASTVALWNLALNPRGGPVQPPNTGCGGCYGLATIDTATESVRLTSAYYELGQASRFIEPGAQRIATNNFVGYDYTGPGVDFVSPALDDVAVVNPDGTYALLAYNNSSAAIAFAVEWDGLYFDYTVPAGATVTFTWDPTTRPAS